MSAAPSAIEEIGARLENGSNAAREAALARLTDLLLLHGEGLDEMQVEKLDRVLMRLAPSVAVPVRAGMAERLGPLSAAPLGILRLLAFDDAIAVAEPVLAGSPRLDDQDLMAAAIEKGPAHRLAICGRGAVSEIVADALAAFPEREVAHALARNPGVRLSPLAGATLVERSRSDETLQDLMGVRPDLPAHLAASLIAVIRESAREQALGRLRPPAPEPAAETPPVAAAQRPGEAELAEAAAGRRLDEVERLFSDLTGLTGAAAARLLREPGNDILLVVGKAMGWSWSTMRALLVLRDPSLTRRHHFLGAEAVFDAAASATAERVLRFLARSQPEIRSA